MKRLLFLTSVLLSVLSMNAQESDDYRPFIEEGKVWVSHPIIDFSEIGIKQQFIVEYNYFQEDTIVADKLCKKWIKDFRNIEGDCLFSCFVSMFEENKQVWFFFRDETVPRLFYDFGAAEGDTMTIYSPDAYYYNQFKEYGILSQHMENFVDTIVVTSWTEEEIHGMQHSSSHFYSITKQKLNARADFLSDNYIIQGIGSHWGPTYNLMWVSNSMGRECLFYCIKGNEILYEDKEKALFWGIPNPTSILTSLLSPSTVNSKSENGKCFDLSGRRLAASPSKGVYIENGKKMIR